MFLRLLSLLLLSTLTYLQAATPIASYHFDEPGWANGATAYDSSREKNHLTAYNGVTRTNSGPNFKVCESAQFDGTDDYMKVTKTSGALLDWMFSFFGTSGNSEALWFKSITNDNHTNNTTLVGRESTQIDGIVDLGGGFNHGDYSVKLFLNNGQICSKSGRWFTDEIEFHFEQQHELCSDTSYLDTNWHHVVHTSGSFSFFFFTYNWEYLYVDNVQKAKETRVSFTDFSPNFLEKVGLYIGTSKSLTTPKYFNGYIDEVNLFDDTLSVNEINSLYSESRICATASTHTNLKLDAWEPSISNSLPIDVNDRKLYTKIVAKEFNLSIGLSDDSAIDETHAVRVRAVPKSYCENENKADYNEFSPWQSVSFEANSTREKNVTFSPIKIADRNAYIQFEIESVTAKYQERTYTCDSLCKLSSSWYWTTWTTVNECSQAIQDPIVDYECVQLDAYTKKTYECVCGMGCSVSSTGSTQTSSCTETVVEECGYIFKEDYQKVVCEKNIDYFVGSETNNTCSSDGFAIRPNSFTSPTLNAMPVGTPMVAGQVYNIDILALDFQDQNTTGYNQSFANTNSEIGIWYKLDGTETNTTYAKENGGRNGEFRHEPNEQTNFVDGNISNVNFSYSEVGYFDVSMVDRDWAKVDITDNNPDENTSIVMTTQTFRVIPYEFNISVNELRGIDFDYDTNSSRFTYLSNSPAIMGARGRIQIDALNARGEITKNYSTGLYENDAKLYIKINTKHDNKGANLQFSGLGTNDWYNISQFAGMITNDAFEGFVSGSMFFDDPNMAHFNFDRNSTNYVNTPFIVEGPKDIDINITDADVVLYKNGEFSHPEGNVTFFYGRINSIDERVLSTNKDSIGLFVEIYCDNETMNCSAFDVNMSNSPTDIDWYLHFEHNENDTYEVNTSATTSIILDNPRLGTFTDVNITSLYGTKDTLVKAYYGSSYNGISYDAKHAFVNGEANMTIGYYGNEKHTVHIRVTPSEWLEHTSKYKSPILKFKVTFPGGYTNDGNDKNRRAGVGTEGISNRHIDSNSSKRSNRRLSW